MPASQVANTVQALPAATNYANPGTYVPAVTPWQTAPVQGASGMPPIAIAAGIGAFGSIVGGVLQNRAQGKALDAQTTANNQAMAYQREQDKKREAAMAAWQANREALLQRYGVDIASTQAPPTQVASAAPVSVAGRTRGTPVPVGATMGDLMERPQGAWNDWSAYGLRGQG